MKRPAHLVTLLLSVFCASLSAAEGDTLRIQPDTFQSRVALQPYLRFIHDPARTLTLDSARFRTMTALPDTPFVFPPQTAYWLRLVLCNTSSTDTLRFWIGAPQFTFDHLDAYLDIPPDGPRVARTGLLLHYRDLSAPKNRRYLALALPPASSAEVWLRAERYFAHFFPSGQIEIVPGPGADQLRRDDWSDYRIDDVVMAIYMGIFALIAWIFGLLWLNDRRESAYLWYALFNVGNFLYYLRLFEALPTQHFFFSYRMGWNLGLEVTTACLIFIAYVQFLRAFLELRERDPLLDRFLRAMMWVSVGGVAVDLLLVKPIWGQEGSYAAFIAVRSVFIAAFFCVYARLLRMIRYGPAAWIIAGALALILNVLATWLVQRFGWPNENAGYGLLRRTTTPGGVFLFLNMRGAFVLEIFFFTIAFALKYRMRQESFLLKNRRLEAEKAELQQKMTQASLWDSRDPFLDVQRRLAEEHLSDPKFDAAALARAQGLSLKSLNTRLRKTACLTAPAFLRRLRLEKAAALLRTHPSLNVSEIADRTGFSGGDVFSNIFRKHFGQSPMEWRRGNGTPNGSNAENPA